MTKSSLVLELTLEALERRENFYLSKLAHRLDNPKAKTFGHEEVWNKESAQRLTKEK